jgi:hypothetical protein
MLIRTYIHTYIHACPGATTYVGVQGTEVVLASALHVPKAERIMQLVLSICQHTAGIRRTPRTGTDGRSCCAAHASFVVPQEIQP